MKRVKLFFAISGLAIHLAFANGANALTLTLSDGSNPTVTIVDGGTGDLNPLTGFVSYGGSLGSFNFNLTTGISSRGPSLASLDLSSLDLSGGAGKLTITLTDTFSNVGLPAIVPNAIASTHISGFTTGNVTFEALVGGTSLFGGTPESFNTFFSGSTQALLATSTPLTLEEIFTITHDGFGITNMVDAGLQVAPVPEPGTILLLGVGLVGIFFFGRKRMK